MKRIIFGLVLLLIISSTAVAAPMLSEFPLGMSQKDAVAKGLVMRDQHGGMINVNFGAKEWPAAMVFENEKLVYIILKGSGNESITAIDDILGQSGWLIIYASTDNNLVFDAIKLASSGMNEEAIGDEYEKYLRIMQSQKYTNSVTIYVSERVWYTFKLLRNENPIEKYPEAVMCNLTTEGNDITLVFSTFGYMNRK